VITRKVSAKRIEATSEDGTGLLELIAARARSSGLEIRRFENRRPTLEDCFLERTGRGLRD
jgi:ABC-type uncharacterized transport system ATPase subunit